jgi:ribosome-associated translation inhibitor RaiA
MFKAVQFTKSNLNDLKRDLDAVLSKYSKEAGVHLTIGNIRFGDLQATIKLTATLPNNSGAFQTAEQKDFDMFSSLDSISVKLNELGSSRNLGTVRML